MSYLHPGKGEIYFSGDDCVHRVLIKIQRNLIQPAMQFTRVYCRGTLRFLFQPMCMKDVVIMAATRVWLMWLVETPESMQTCHSTRIMKAADTPGCFYDHLLVYRSLCYWTIGSKSVTNQWWSCTERNVSKRCSTDWGFTRKRLYVNVLAQTNTKNPEYLPLNIWTTPKLWD